MSNKFLATVLFLLLLQCKADALIQLPALISDHMVLQQNSNITLWGTAEAGEKIRIDPSWTKKRYKTTAATDGTWRVEIATGKAGGPYFIKFSGYNAITVEDVYLGEVWLASGQSNMEFHMEKAEGWRTGVLNYQQEMARANFPGIRMIDVPNTVADSPRNDFAGKWEVCSPATVGNFSAVAFYFALTVNAKTGFPVGIINATWGGTPAESWTRKEVLESSSAFASILKRYNNALAEYPEKYEAYKKNLAAWKANTDPNKKGAPKEPMGPKHNKSPYKLYNGMIAPLLPYKLKGVIWYQGESNVEHAWQYRKLFPALIANWRTDFRDKELPFYFVQIAPHKGQNPVIREAQFYTWNTVPHTGMVVTTDVGDANDIHPRNKKPVGERLARYALHNQYGYKDVCVSGPAYTGYETKGHFVWLDFKYDGGIKVSGIGSQGFVVAGADRRFYPADIAFEGNRIKVWSDKVPHPVAVRYGWSNVPQASLFNACDLPASPFRTDDWPVETQGID
ncbi:MAG: sialate O-acetylesterase [Edaphocola sp.]